MRPILFLQTATLCMSLLPQSAGVEVYSLYKPLPLGLLSDYSVFKDQVLQVELEGFEPS